MRRVARIFLEKFLKIDAYNADVKNDFDDFNARLAEENDASRADDGDRRAEKFFDDAAFAEEAPT